MNNLPEIDAEKTEVNQAKTNLPPARVASANVYAEIGALSHAGKIRANNEDHYAVWRFGRTLDTLLTNLSPEFAPLPHAEVGYGLVVADGLGGAAAGEFASRYAILDLWHLVLNTPDWILDSENPLIEEVMRRMVKRFRDIDRYINVRAATNPALTGMGTTMTLACSLGFDMILCHIGDTRAYLFREGQLTQITRDMTIAQELIDAGTIDSTKAATSQFRHVLTQCLGGPGAVKVEVQHLTLQDGDRVLLCSDGLYDMVADTQIAETLYIKSDGEEACHTLLNQALEAGGKDNTTVLLARYRQLLSK